MKKIENFKKGKDWSRIDLHRTQSPVRLNDFRLFLKAVYAWIFRDASGIAFHDFDAAYLHDTKLLILLTFGRTSLMVPHVVGTSVTHSAAPRMPLCFSYPHFDVICEFLLSGRTASWNKFVKYIQEKTLLSIDIS